MSAKEKSTFSHFFKEDAFTKELIKDASKKQVEEAGTIKKDAIPEILISKDVSEDESTSYWQSLRAFFRNGNNSEGLSDTLSPVILAPLYTKSLVGSEFPLWLADEKFTGDGDFCLSLREIISQSLKDIESVEEVNLLNENIERILHIANTQLQD